MAKKHKENMISIPSSLAGLVERAQGVQTIPAMPPIGGRREESKEEKPAAEAAAPVPAHETAAPTQSETAPVQSASAPTRQETAPAQQPSAPNGRPVGEEVASPAVAPAPSAASAPSADEMAAAPAARPASARDTSAPANGAVESAAELDDAAAKGEEKKAPSRRSKRGQEWQNFIDSAVAFKKNKTYMETILIDKDMKNMVEFLKSIVGEKVTAKDVVSGIVRAFAEENKDIINEVFNTRQIGR